MLIHAFLFVCTAIMEIRIAKLSRGRLLRVLLLFRWGIWEVGGPGLVRKWRSAEMILALSVGVSTLSPVDAGLMCGVSVLVGFVGCRS
jgi:hypothetical protein